jgi:phosphoinositide-3-kinase regulatory subunit 4
LSTTGPVNQLKASRDNLFFASCSDDGTVKIWDCQRLTNQKNVTNRSRLTYSSQGTPFHFIVLFHFLFSSLLLTD